MEFQTIIREKKGTVKKLKETNKKLLDQLKGLNSKLDTMLIKVKQRQIQDVKAAREPLCSHGPTMERLNELISSKYLLIPRPGELTAFL